MAVRKKLGMDITIERAHRTAHRVADCGTGNRERKFSAKPEERSQKVCLSQKT